MADPEKWPRHGAWAVDEQGRVGIAQIREVYPLRRLADVEDLQPDDPRDGETMVIDKREPPELVWDFHRVAVTGETMAVDENINGAALIKARIREIPKTRLDTSNMQTLKKLGYE